MRAIIPFILVAASCTPDPLEPCGELAPQGECPGARVCAQGQCVVPLDDGAPLVGDELARWDEIWTFLDDNYGAFNAQPAFNWDLVRDEVGAQIAISETLFEAERAMQLGVARIGDGHTALSPPSVCALDPGFSLELTTVGACVVETEDLVDTGDGLKAPLVVNEIFRPDTPLRPGDIIVSVDERPWFDLVDDHLAQPRCQVAASTPAQARAAAVASVLFRTERARITVLRGDSLLELEVTPGGTSRCSGRAPPIGRFLDEESLLEFAQLESGFGYIYLPAFGVRDEAGQFVAAPVEAALEATLEQLGELPGLIVDLRGNAGGFVSILQLLAGSFVGDDQPLYTCSVRIGGALGAPFDISSEAGFPLYEGALAILVDARTFSAGDFAALALGPNTARAVVVGEPSAGGFGSQFFAEVGGQTLAYSPLLCEDSAGAFLEGNPPDVDAPAAHRLADLARGRDRVIAAAERALARAIIP